MFVVSIIIAGVLLAKSTSAQQVAVAACTRLAGDRGVKLVELPLDHLAGHLPRLRGKGEHAVVREVQKMGYC